MPKPGSKASDAPQCKLCGGQHWAYEPHVGGPRLVTGVTAASFVAKPPMTRKGKIVPPQLRPAEEKTRDSRSNESVTDDVTEPVVAAQVTPVVTADGTHVVVPGQPCPCCGQKVPMYASAAEKQAAYRARRQKGSG